MVRVLDELEARGIAVWVDGGWGVDALLGEQTRSHNDLDVVIPHTQLDHFNKVVTERGFLVDVQHTAFNWELVDEAGIRIDVHLVDVTCTRTDRFGMQVYGPGGLEYEVGSLEGTGVITGRPVKCCTADFQVRSHTGYELSETDYHDVFALHNHFSVPLPYPYDPCGDRTNWMSRMDGIA